MNDLGTEGPSSAARLKAVAKFAASIACVGAALWMVDRDQLRALLLRADLGWLALGIAISTGIYAAQAVRWSFIARRMRLALSFREALLECYLGSLLNQILPTGYAGESVRILRLTAANRGVPQATARAVLTVVLDRLSGQWILWSCIGLSVPLWVSDRKLALLCCALTVVLALASLILLRRPARLLPRRLAIDARPYLDDVAYASVARGAWSLQLSTSLVSVLGCLAMYFCALRALAVELAVADFWRVAPLMLAATSLPISFAGWGPREIASAALFTQIGLTAASGTAASIAYGLMSLLASLPGVFAWWRR